MEDIRNILPKNEEKKAKFLSFIALAVMLITVWYMLDLVLLTFLLSFIFYHLLAKVQEGYRKRVAFRIPDGLVLTVLYLLFIGLLTIIGSELVPRGVVWTAEMGEQIMKFDIFKFMDSLDSNIGDIVSPYLHEGGLFLTKYLGSLSTTVGGLTLDFLLAMLLSFVILMEKGKIREFGKRLESSKISFIYQYFMLFGGNFCATFGKVMKVQITIAFVNCILSMIGLKLIGFNSLLPLGIMIFVLGLIPVAGVLISLIPLCIIGFNLGGIIKVVEILIMICVLHAVEAYVLNPKLMSAKTRLPVCFVFIILLVGEHYLDVWGLLIGVPIFIFLMNMLDVDYEVDGEEKKFRKGEKKKKNPFYRKTAANEKDIAEEDSVTPE